MERDSEVRSVEENVRRVVRTKIIEERLFGSGASVQKIHSASHILSVVVMWQERLKTFYSFSSFKVLEDYS